MESARSLRARAVLAVLLAGFYLFGLAIVTVLMGVHYLYYLATEQSLPYFLGASLAASATILAAMRPRVDRFEPPGPALVREDAPALFDMIDEIAAATGQPAPAEVYLLPDVNASVAQRGGLMGIGSRRVMGISVPLLTELPPQAVRAVIAHEFGHFVSGDVLLGPWIHKTHAAIGRTIAELEGRATLQSMFAWYARLFLRVTRKVAREQEFVADAVAARIAGAVPMADALTALETLGPAYAHYIQWELVPALNAGFLPPVVEGFKRFMTGREVMQGCENLPAEPACIAEQFDTHPPTRDRVAAIGRLALPAAPAQTVAAPLLRDAERQSVRMLEFLNPLATIGKHGTITWQEVGDKVHAPICGKVAKQYAHSLGMLTADQIPANHLWFVLKGNDLTGEQAPQLSPAVKLEIAVFILSEAVGARLVHDGWHLDCPPGSGPVFEKDGRRFNPRACLTQLANGVMPHDAWVEACASMGISGVPLALPAATEEYRQCA